MAMLPNGMINNECVLIVDDSKTMRDSLSTLISTLNCQTVTANDGIEALNVLQLQHIDLVITDLLMPNMTGLELLSTIRKEYSDNTLPVILLSGSVDKQVEQQARQLGVSEVLRKPFEANKLLLIVLKQLTLLRGRPCYSNLAITP
ncbi:response regulator [Rheinheimera sp. UJ51]|uniref:response regulator n=1 Tax=Rheinheimera sp. UJ51 TaxID=2892446 RepID=UPI001E34E449|nr:response regulator [Rheinheimera sp. UJ51]MCC5451836.1 response regulator [Rheinheimera sp. UJ51]